MAFKRRRRVRRGRRLRTARRGRRGRSGRGGLSIGRYRGHTIPDKQIVKLRYCESYHVAVGGPLGAYLWNLNSLFDPDRTGVGHQPMGYDQWTPFYNRYRVFAVRGTIRALNMQATQAFLLTILPQNVTTAPAIASVMQEQKGAQTKLISNSTTGGVPQRMSFKWSLPKIVGQTPSQYKANVDYQALTSASPAETICMLMAFSAVDQATALNQCMIYVDITYYAEMFDRTQLATS